MVFAQPGLVQPGLVQLGLVQPGVTLFFADVGRSPDLTLIPVTDPEPHP
ncbi:hypothetical protein HPC62_22805 [Thermoleptolyngbya sichuanensis A183]|uniref:Uncharacterized protein n=1 Tax=Thermoleptolyngbya sichuanensis A183 TaxID=2737172 RepID=A0A6M8BK83_9CYAN|nr:hypothetical protein [Thermoleptolyngbya sichuanensis]QKD84640.1 hypothetical protein HPC62_22805 [Thermoleptolyngbya sichuanensis A183]